jgi:hypothetical protein
MRVLLAATMIALLVGPAYAQTPASVPRYGEAPKDKTAQEIAAEKEAQKAYQRSLGNIPDQGPTDPWGNVRSDGAPKPAAKTAAKAVVPAKRAKTGSAAN